MRPASRQQIAADDSAAVRFLDVWYFGTSPPLNFHFLLNEFFFLMRISCLDSVLCGRTQDAPVTKGSVFSEAFDIIFAFTICDICSGSHRHVFTHALSSDRAIL
jgi:hypothetical protein